MILDHNINHNTTERWWGKFSGIQYYEQAIFLGFVSVPFGSQFVGPPSAFLALLVGLPEPPTFSFDRPPSPSLETAICEVKRTICIWKTAISPRAKRRNKENTAMSQISEENFSKRPSMEAKKHESRNCWLCVQPVRPMPLLFSSFDSECLHQALPWAAIVCVWRHSVSVSRHGWCLYSMVSPRKKSAAMQTSAVISAWLRMRLILDDVKRNQISISPPLVN